MLERLEIEVGEREDEKLQLINDIAQQSVQLLMHKSQTRALRDEIDMLELGGKQAGHDIAAVDSQLRAERKKLLQGWEEEMRKERQGRGRELEEERTRWKSEMQRQHGMLLEEQEKRRAATAEQVMELQRTLSDLQSQEEMSRDSARRDRALQILQERSKIEEIGEIKDSISRLKVEEESLRVSTHRERTQVWSCTTSGLRMRVQGLLLGVRAHIFTYVNKNMHIYIYICTYININRLMYIYVYIYTYIHICTYMYIYIQKYVYSYTHMYIYIYIYVCI